MQKILILNGPNLNLVGIREPEIYGSTSFLDYYKELQSIFTSVNIEYAQSNHEGILIDLLHDWGFEKGVGIVLNAGAYTHTSIALADAIKAIEAPVVEVHISNIQEREDFRKHSYLTKVCNHHIIGKGLPGYKEAIDWLISKND